MCGKDFNKAVPITTWRRTSVKGAVIEWEPGNENPLACDILAPIIDMVNTRSALLILKEVNELGSQLYQTTVSGMLGLGTRRTPCVTRKEQKLDRT